MKKANLKYTDNKLKAVEATIDRLQLLYEVKMMDSDQIIAELDARLIEKLVDIFSYEKYDVNFNYDNLNIINFAFDVECWHELPKKKMEKDSIKRILLDNYFRPAAMKLLDAYDAQSVAKLDRLSQTGIVCLVLEIDEFFSHSFEESVDGEMIPLNVSVVPSIIDLCEMRSEIFC